MLRPAQLYKEQLEMEHINTWYKPEYIYYSGGTGDNIIELPEDCFNSHCFVSVDNDDNIIGYISYNVDYNAMSVNNLGIINFKKNDRRNSVIFIHDVCKTIYDLFNVYHMNRLEWWCIADNPAINGYRSFIKRYGGREVGYYRQIAKLRDGRLHDSVTFEIMAAEFKNDLFKKRWINGTSC